MNIRNVTRIGLGLALTLALAAPALAQGGQPPAPAAKAPATSGSIGDNVGDLSFGYDYISVTTKSSGVTETFSKGWYLEGGKRVARGISLVLYFGNSQGNNITGTTLQTLITKTGGSPLRLAQSPAKLWMYEAGVRFSTKNNAMANGHRMMFKPFAEFTFGGANDNATNMNHFSSMHITGGVDLQFSGNSSIRLEAGAPFFFYFAPVQLGWHAQAGYVLQFHKK